jgi:type III secretion system YscI/HrpB-like protein
MSEILPIEAIRAIGYTDPARTGALSAAPIADPAAIDRFEAAMAAPPVEEPKAIDPIPFADTAAAAWRTAQINNQGLLHRIRELSSLGTETAPAAGELLQLQYEVANLSFQQQVVTKVADKASSAVQTLIKNQ